MKWVFGNYKKYAWGKDELRPTTRDGHDPWGGMGVTLVDSLDTLWLMGLKDEFNESIEWIKSSLDFNKVNPGDGYVSVFETTIRSLGGMLSAYDMSQEPILKEKAIDLGDRLFKAFDCSKLGIPCGQIRLNGNPSPKNAGWTGGASLLAEVGTLQVEFRYLSKITGNSIYKEKADHVFDVIKPQGEPNYASSNHRGRSQNRTSTSKSAAFRLKVH